MGRPHRRRHRGHLGRLGHGDRPAHGPVGDGPRGLGGRGRAVRRGLGPRRGVRRRTGCHPAVRPVRAPPRVAPPRRRPALAGGPATLGDPTGGGGVDAAPRRLLRRGVPRGAAGRPPRLRVARRVAHLRGPPSGRAADGVRPTRRARGAALDRGRRVVRDPRLLLTRAHRPPRVPGRWRALLDQRGHPPLRGRRPRDRRGPDVIGPRPHHVGRPRRPVGHPPPARARGASPARRGRGGGPLRAGRRVAAGHGAQRDGRGPVAGGGARSVLRGGPTPRGRRMWRPGWPGSASRRRAAA